MRMRGLAVPALTRPLGDGEGSGAGVATAIVVQLAICFNTPAVV